MITRSAPLFVINIQRSVRPFKAGEIIRRKCNKKRSARCKGLVMNIRNSVANYELIDIHSTHKGHCRNRGKGLWQKDCVCFGRIRVLFSALPCQRRLQTLALILLISGWNCFFAHFLRRIFFQQLLLLNTVHIAHNHNSTLIIAPIPPRAFFLSISRPCEQNCNC